MKPYLPSATQPWSRKIRRRHSPTGSYSRFKHCLQWEFGFTCAFCLLHAVDLNLAGIDGWSLMHAEHAILKSKSPSQKNRYRNCFYICARCNWLRGTWPNKDKEGNHLLNPCRDVWADHFQRAGDEILPRAGDGSAAYTWEAYGLNDKNKVTLREQRRTWIEKYADSLVQFERFERRLVDEIVRRADEVEESTLVKKLDLATELREITQPFRDKLDQYRVIPRDAASSCHCDQSDDLRVPEVLAEQAVDLEDLLRQARERRDQSRSGDVN